MKLIKYAILALALVASVASHAQATRSQGTITTQNLVAAGACTTGGCVEIDVANRGAVTVQVTGAYTGALSGQATTDGVTWVTLAASGSFTNVASGATSATITSASTGLYRVAGVVGALRFRIAALAAVTGTATITLQTAPVPPESSTTISGGAGDASAANQVTGNASLASIDGKLPALSGSRVPVVDLTSVAQASTTSGQSGQLVQGAVTTAAPTYTTAQTSPLSLDTSGSLRVAIMSGAGSGGTASTVGAATPATATAIGGNDGTNMQVPRVADLDTGAGTQYSLVVSPRLGASGGGVELVGGAGAVSAGVLRTTQASDSPLVAAAGAVADSVCGTDTGSCSTIALAKKIAANITAQTSAITADPNYSGVIGAATAPTRMLLGGGVYNSTPLTLTNGQSAALQVSSSGALLVSGAAGATEYTEDAAAAANPQGPMMMAVRRDTLSGSEVSADGDNIAVKATSSGQVHVFAQLGTGSATIGALTANQSVNVAQINGVTPLMGAGNTGTGSPRVTIATDQAAIATHGHGATGSAVPANAQLAGGRAGANMISFPVSDTTAPITMSTATTTQMIALSGSTRTWIDNLSIISAGATNVTLVYGTGTNCATSPSNLSGAYPLAANTGLVLQRIVVPAGQALCVTNSAAIQISGHVTYTQF
jgi:hypothetical protein